MTKHITRLLALAAFALAAPVATAAAQGYEVVVNAGVGAGEVGKDVLAKIFLKQVTSIGGAKVVPVDQAKDSPARAAFTKAVHGKTVSAIEGYWQQQIFSGGSLPPSIKAADADVLAHVRSTPGAIGYVTAGTALGAGAKVIKVTP